MANADVMRAAVEKLIRDLFPLQQATVAQVHPADGTVDLAHGDGVIEGVSCSSAYTGRARQDKVLVVKLTAGNWIVLCRCESLDTAPPA